MRLIFSNGIRLLTPDPEATIGLTRFDDLIKESMGRSWFQYAFQAEDTPLLSNAGRMTAAASLISN